MNATPRSASQAQIVASRMNGAKSSGPRTSGGKAASSVNALTHGLYSKALLGPGLDVETVRSEFDAWVGAYGVTSPAAYRLAARGAAAILRLDQVDSIRDKILAAVLDKKVAESEPAKSLERTREAREAVAGLGALAADIREPVPRSDAMKLIPALRAVVQGVLELPVAPGAGLPLAASVGLIEDEGIDDVELEVFEAIAANCRELLNAIDGAIPELVTKVEAERARQEELLLMADDKRLRDADRVRNRLIKEIETVARALAAIRDLEHCPGRDSRAGSTDLPPIEFKIVGGLAGR